MDAYFRSQELAGAASLGLVSAIRLGFVWPMSSGTASRAMYSDDCTLSAALLSKLDVLHSHLKKCLRPRESLERF